MGISSTGKKTAPEETWKFFWIYEQRTNRFFVSDNSLFETIRSILTLPRSKGDHNLLPPVDPRLEDVYSLGILIWRIFSGKSPWNGTIEDDIKVIRHMVSSDTQIQFYLQREVTGKVSRELLLKCLTAESETRSTAEGVKEFLAQEGVAAELLKEFEELGSGRKKTRKNLD